MQLMQYCASPTVSQCNFCNSMGEKMPEMRLFHNLFKAIVCTRLNMKISYYFYSTFNPKN